MQTSSAGIGPAIYSKLVESDPAFSEVVELFVAGLPARLEAMEQALRICDFQGLRSLAHRLKGTGSGHGYAVLSEQASRLEQLAPEQDARALWECLAGLRAIQVRIRVRPERSC